ncbi:DMT family transporter [Cryobacterium sp. Sr8]|uniref:Threonine/homoserine efflux transporter RhtA n=1 Tax=Cryobacterium psychrotolerans TaxID=386301 RepID=A0A1G9E3I3_9MICO|nr:MULTISPECIES: DMT family transporter [Cryobacterium]TFD45559.1 DMT family transporter [Cryobacterium sp. TMT1-2-1]TFD78691.1 DMT family transporter [Cryobacterium sp. Sr8]TFD86437.1 DMT family transporter [Cryobacterium psychrotolerans]SDK70663.1 Threonine/homoserine efflux transporter RhtA [Cryobacterium psychrotolerans]
MGYLFALVASLLFGLNGSTTKVIVEAGLSPAQLTFARVTIIALLAGVLLLATNRAAFRIDRSQLAVMALLGVAGVALIQWFYAVAISLLPVGIALMLEYSGVLLIALVVRFVFKEKVKSRIWVAIVFVLIGMAIVAEVWASRLSAPGVVAGILAAICLAVYFLVGERQVATTSPLAVAFWSMLFASAFWLLFSAWWQIDPAILTQQTSLGGNMGSVSFPLWGILLWNGVFGSFAPYLLSYMALGRLNATAAGVVSASEVIFAFAFAFLWLGESLTGVQAAGAVLVLIGIVVAQTARSNKAVDLDLASQDLALAKGPPD